MRPRSGEACLALAGPHSQECAAGAIGPGEDIEIPIPASFRLERGGALADRLVRARLYGAAGAPMVAVLGGISAGRLVADERASGGGEGWWASLVRPGGGVDPARWRILGMDFAPLSGDEPVAITPADQARLLALAVDEAASEPLHAVVGASYGGMIAQHFAIQFPHLLQRLALLCTAHRPHPMSTAWRDTQRRILAFARRLGEAEEGVAIARALAMTTYRSPEEFAQRFEGGADAPDDPMRNVLTYLAHHGEAYRRTMPSARFESLSLSIDLHRADPARIAAPTLVVAADSDRLCPPGEARALFDLLPSDKHFAEIGSLYGHDAFLKESGQIEPLIRDCLEARHV